MDDLQRLTRAATKSRASDDRADRDRADRNALIVDVLDKGIESQAAVCRAVGLTREQVRRIAEAERKRRQTVQDPKTTPTAGPVDTQTTS